MKNLQAILNKILWTYNLDPVKTIGSRIHWESSLAQSFQFMISKFWVTNFKLSDFGCQFFDPFSTAQFNLFYLLVLLC